MKIVPQLDRQPAIYIRRFLTTLKTSRRLVGLPSGRPTHIVFSDPWSVRQVMWLD